MDVRYKQRLENYKNALATIKEAVELSAVRPLANLEKQGLIKGFEFTFELAWNVMKDFLEEQGINDILGSKNAIRHSFSKGLISNGEIWMSMVKNRNLSTHSYDENTSEKLVKEIIETYYGAFVEFEKKMNSMG